MGLASLRLSIVCSSYSSCSQIVLGIHSRQLSCIHVPRLMYLDGCDLQDQQLLFGGRGAQLTRAHFPATAGTRSPRLAPFIDSLCSLKSVRSSVNPLHILCVVYHI